MDVNSAICESVGGYYDVPPQVDPHVTIRDGKVVCGACRRLIDQAVENLEGQRADDER